MRRVAPVGLETGNLTQFVNFAAPTPAPSLVSRKFGTYGLLFRAKFHLDRCLLLLLLGQKQQFFLPHFEYLVAPLPTPPSLPLRKQMLFGCGFRCLTNKSVIDCRAMLGMLLCHFCSDLSRVPRLRDSSRRRTKQFHVVLSTWVADCISAGKLLDERCYQPVLECVMPSA